MRQVDIPGYESWKAMRRRCDVIGADGYWSYGGKGITYDPRWNLYENFLADMGIRPEGKTLDRYPDRTGNYSKVNCRWATPKEQSANRTLVLPASGVIGITFESGRGRWKATGQGVLLYQGRNFFEACCARKSWDASQRISRC